MTFVLIATLLALSAAAQTASQSPVQLAATWTLEATGYGFDALIQLHALYRIKMLTDPATGRLTPAGCEGRKPMPFATLKDGAEFCVQLEYLGGGLVVGDGGEGDSRATYGDASPVEGPATYNPGSRARMLDPGGIIRASGSGAVEIALLVGPGFQGVAGPADEALGCLFATAPAPTISYADLRTLGSLRREWHASVEGPSVAPPCKSTISITIAAVGREPTCKDGGSAEPESRFNAPLTTALRASGWGGNADAVYVYPKAGMTGFVIRLGPGRMVLPSQPCLEQAIAGGRVREGSLAGAQTLLIGSIQQTADTTRVTVREVEVETGTVLQGGKADAAGTTAGSVQQAATGALGQVHQ